MFNNLTPEPHWILYVLLFIGYVMAHVVNWYSAKDRAEERMKSVNIKKPQEGIVNVNLPPTMLKAPNFISRSVMEK